MGIRYENPSYATVQNDVSLTKLLNTVYQNTHATPMRVCVTVQSNLVCTLQALSDSANPPTTQVDAGAAPQTFYTKVTFDVLAGNYYEVVCSDAGATIVGWSETY